MMRVLSRRQFGAGLLASSAAALTLPNDAIGAVGAKTAEDARLIALLSSDARRDDAIDALGGLYRGASANLTAFRQLYTDAPLRAARANVAQSLKALARINRDRLSAERRISYDAYLFMKRQDAVWLQPDMIALTAVRPFNHFGGLHIEFASLMAKGGPVRYENQNDYAAALQLLEAFPQVLDNAVARFRQGLASGVVETRLTTTNMIAQIDAVLAQRLANSPFLSAVQAFPAALPAANRAALKARFEAAVGQGIYPAYRRLRDFLEGEYLPQAREAVGVWAMKGGKSLYAAAIAQHTTLQLDPDAVHQLGLSEVARIQREMDGVRQRLGFAGPLRAFFDEVRSNPRYHPKTKDELAKAFAEAGRAVDAQVPKYFNHTPKTKLLIEPYPAYRERYEAGGSYNQGSPDGARPGIFYFNAYDLPSRFLTGVVTLYLHEGAPGHHFQISLAQEDTSLPDFQRFGGANAFVEGWALYAETLGYEMGFYQDPMQHWGTLDDEMLRAMRLVVDTGLHAKGWSREQGIEYMLANSGMGRSDATAEVERYIVWPGQALGYKIGALTIQRLRREAEARLGAHFDICDFHDQVLRSGALPMPVLEAKVRRWIALPRQP